MISPSIRAVYFDAVGTLLFPQPSVFETYAAVARKHGSQRTLAEIKQAMRAAYHRQELVDRDQQWRTDEDRERERWRGVVGETMPDADVERSFAELWGWFSGPEAWSVAPGTAELLRNLVDRGLVVGMASNFDARLAPITRAIPELGLLADRLVISSVVGWRKPATEFFEVVIKQSGHRADEILFVGDDLQNDYEGARAAGMQAVHLGEANVTPAIRSLQELLG